MMNMFRLLARRNNLRLVLTEVLTGMDILRNHQDSMQIGCRQNLEKKQSLQLPIY